ncbi:hypothetical protein GT347_21435 [Xylophilus rhododendri]|uniref:Uncharacterized protein n=1 Tax=Xylophilus rhododendri TaxID=2697032 RepID=A0A857JAS9_9BURK|nr:hypothetical protein [Xylophilus rhododendri]QHJ00314.1 hypothetical protein GT347_21435 [Xylophilus rhododendri]
MLAGVTVSGTAAVGAALANASVAVRCHGGNGSASTGTSGAYSVTVTGASLPCMLQLTSGSTVLYGLATGSGQGSATANITPLTHLILGTAAHADPAAVFAAFNAASFGDAQLAQARTAVAAALAAAGIQIGGDSPLSDSFRIGDALDAKLDALAASLRSGGSSLADLAYALREGAADLAAGQLTAPPVPACPQLRDGKYQAVYSDGSSGVLSLQFSGPVPSASQWVTTSGGFTSLGGPIRMSAVQACQFSFAGLQGKTYEAAASQQGIFALRDSSGPVGFAFPMQSLALADLAGNWNTVEYGPGETGFSTLTISAAGRLDVRECAANADACTGEVTTTGIAPAVRPNPTTGAALPRTFAITNPANGAALVALHAYRSPTGGMFLVAAYPGQGLMVASRQSALPLPDVGRVGRYWTAEVQTTGSSFSYGGNRITSVDAATGRVDRIDLLDASTQYRLYNKPRDGMRVRPVQTTGGRSYNSLVQLVPAGSGLTVYAGASGAVYFGVSVDDR